MRRYTTHILSSTRLSGLAYELSPLEVLPLSISTTLESIGFVDPPPCDDLECPVHGAENREKERKRRDARSAAETGEVILRRNGDVVIFDRVATSGGSTVKRRRAAGEPVERGFEREIGRVVVEPNRSELLPRFDSHDEEIDEALDRDLEVEQDIGGGSRRVVWRRFWRVVFRVGFYVVYRAVRAVKVGVAKVTGWGRDEGAMQDAWRVQTRARSRSCTPAVHGGDAEEDDEDEDYSPDESADEEDSAPMLVYNGGTDAWEEMRSVHSDEAVDEGDPMTLFSDLSDGASRSTTDAPTPQELAPYLLAHHLSGSSTPLTRRRYRALLPSSTASPSPGPSNSLTALSTAISQRRNEIVESAPHGEVERWMEEKREEWRESRSRFCVVCTVEERTIVLWPCRGFRPRRSWLIPALTSPRFRRLPLPLRFVPHDPLRALHHRLARQRRRSGRHRPGQRPVPDVQDARAGFQSDLCAVSSTRSLLYLRLASLHTLVVPPLYSMSQLALLLLQSLRIARKEGEKRPRARSILRCIGRIEGAGTSPFTERSSLAVDLVGSHCGM